MKASPMQKCEKMKGNEGGRFSNHYPITGWVIGRWSLFLLSAIFCITMYNSLITNFVTKKNWIMRSTFKVLFYVNGSKEKNGIVPIMGRVTINGSVPSRWKNYSSLNP